MLIVAGHFDVDPAERDEFITSKPDARSSSSMRS